MTFRTRVLLVFLLVGAAGCAAVKKSPIYEGPFQAEKEYVADAPVSAWIGDNPHEAQYPESQVVGSPVRAIRDPVILVPGTQVEFIRKDSPYLVFRVKSGDHAGRYAWVYQHGEEVRYLSEVPVPSPGGSP